MPLPSQEDRNNVVEFNSVTFAVILLRVYMGNASSVWEMSGLLAASYAGMFLLGAATARSSQPVQAAACVAPSLAVVTATQRRSTWKEAAYVFGLCVSVFAAGHYLFKKEK